MSVARRAKDMSPRWVKDVADAGTRAWGVATSGARPWPDFLLVGTKRGGTTSLWNNLVHHPCVLPMFPGVRGLKSTDWFFADDRHGERWYRSHFDTRQRRRRVSGREGSAVVSGEASPYYMWDPRIPPRIAATVPGVKVLVVLRDPVARAYSHYQERLGQGVETLAFGDALAAEDGRLSGELEHMLEDPGYHSTAHDWFSYRSRGVYEPQVRRLQDLFGDRLLVLASESMYADEQATFDRVCDFLGVRRHGYARFEHHNKTRSDPMPASVRDDLTTFYAPHNEALYRLTGVDHGWSR